jgi:hypothetical protein
MRKLILLLLILVITDTGSQGQNAPVSRPNNIKGGFYMKFGPAFPVGDFNTTQYTLDEDFVIKTFDQPKAGMFGDFGYLIYLGPAFAKNYLRVGIDATFFSVGFMGSHHDVQPNEDKINYKYFFAGQKFGPMITVNPVDHLMIDLSWKLCLSISEFNELYGLNMTQQEISMGLRYRIMAFSVNYQMGDLNFNKFDKEGKDQIINQNMVKIMIGLKF